MLRVTTAGDGRPALHGELDMESADALEVFLAQLDGQGEVDLSEVTFFDSSALRCFVMARRHNDKVRIVNPSLIVVRVLEVSAMLDYLVAGRETDW